MSIGKVSELYFIFRYPSFSMRQYLTLSSTMLLSLLLVGAVFATAFVPRNAVAEEDPRFCGPMDVTIALDDTGSMGGAISNIVGSLPAIIDQAQAASGPDGLPDTADDDLRLGYITFKDEVVVHHELTNALGAVEASIAGTVASGGTGLPEASDEAKNTAINNLAARPGQIGDFDDPWRAGAVNILILITDAPPGGFNDVTDPDDVARMHDVAVTAAGLGIRISDVFVPTAGDYAGQAAMLEDDALTSGGVFITTAADGTGTADAIMAIIETCGTANDDPDCSTAAPSVATLWPPSHKMKSVTVEGVTDPDEDEVTVMITGIFQDEPTNGLGDGDQSPDGAGVGTDTAEVRAERSGTGDGRVYHIMFTAEDGAGGSCTGEVLVTVPHDQSGAAAVDQGALFDSTVA
ncbi:MAG TPA: vWA domain-containing protein [Nitrososphaera sp.]